MFVFKAALRPLFRRRLRSLIVVAVSLVIVLFLNIYANSIDEHKQTLDKLHANIEVTGYITDLDGNIDGLRIDDMLITALEGSGYIREGVYTLRIFGMMGPWQGVHTSWLTYYNRNSRTLVGTNSVSALSQPPEYMDGYDDKLFESEEMVCIVTDAFLNEHGLKIGEQVQFTAIETINYPVVSEGDVLYNTVTLKIVGRYMSYVNPGPIYCPLEIATDLCRNINKPLALSSAKFTLQNTQELNRFRDLLQGLDFVNQQAGSNSSRDQGLSFIISDRLLKNATSSVENYIAFTSALQPFIYLLCAGIGFVISYLLIRIRKPEFAIMRSLGASRTVGFLTFFIEQVFLCSMGAVFGLVVSTIITRQFSELQIISVLGYSSLYMMGSGLAIMAMNRVNVIKILTAKE